VSSSIGLSPGAAGDLLKQALSAVLLPLALCDGTANLFTTSCRIGDQGDVPAAMYLAC
jgi:hypothetical protein